MTLATSHILDGLKNLVNPDLDSLIPGLRHENVARADRLRREAPDTIAAAATWILDHSAEICDIVEAGTPVMPMSRQMLTEAFKNCVLRWTNPDEIRAYVKEELSPVGSSRAVVPRTIFHNLAGNLFLSGWESLTQATLLGAASIMRCSEDDRVFPGVWARAITTVNPYWEGQIAICEWPSADTARFATAATLSDSLCCYGTNESVLSLRRLCPWNKPFAGHGSTVSFAWVDSEELRNHNVEKLADAIIRDFSLYDQQGCLSPRALFIEDRIPRDVDRLVDALLDGARQQEKNLPRVQLSLEERASHARKRDEVLLDAACGGSSRRVSSDSDAFLITVKPISHFRLGPANRYVDIYLYKEVKELADALRPAQGSISTLGVVDPEQALPAELADLLVRRVCSLGTMQIPPLVWCLDGLRPLQKFLRYQSVQV